MNWIVITSFEIAAIIIANYAASEKNKKGR